MMVRFLTMLLLLFAVIASVQMHGNDGCLEEERIGLLELKAFFISASDVRFVDQILVSWVDDKESDCCQWEKVKCNVTTWRVTELLLNAAREYRSDSEYRIQFLNFSLFHPFEELRSLDLSHNLFDGGEAYDSLRSLKQLKMLNLESNRFNASMLSYLSKLTSLANLNLARNYIGFMPMQGLANLKNLKILDLSYNFMNVSLEGPVYDSLGNLKKLKILDLRGNQFNSSIFPYLNRLTSLVTLNLASNNIEDFSSIQAYDSLGNLKKLKILDLRENQFNSSIFPYLSELTSLVTLNLAWNHIEDFSFIQDLANLKNLEILDLSYNLMNVSLKGPDIWYRPGI